MLSNQRLLISVFDAQEAREAILGGARVIDCEDPSGALGDISPVRVMAIADGVIGYQRNLDLQISTNIGENQMLFKDDGGRAVARFPDEIAGKAAQAALGVAAAMGTALHPVNIVKVGLDNMPIDVARRTLLDVREALDRNPLFSRSQVVAVFFAQNLELWEKRSADPSVLRELVLGREFFVDEGGKTLIEVLGGEEAALAFIKKVKDSRLFNKEKPNPETRVKITQLGSRKPLGFSNDKMTYAQQIADLTAAVGADGLMIDTRIHSKVARICFLDEGTAQANNPNPALPLTGIYSLIEVGQIAEYCHFKGIEFWASGSLQPFQAQPLWDLRDAKGVPLVDGMAVRGGASAAVRTATGKLAPEAAAAGADTRGSKRVYRDLVSVYAPKS